MASSGAGLTGFLLARTVGRRLARAALRCCNAFGGPPPALERLGLAFEKLCQLRSLPAAGRRDLRPIRGRHPEPRVERRELRRQLPFLGHDVQPRLDCVRALEPVAKDDQLALVRLEIRERREGGAVELRQPPPAMAPRRAPRREGWCLRNPRQLHPLVSRPVVRQPVASPALRRWRRIQPNLQRLQTLRVGLDSSPNGAESRQRGDHEHGVFAEACQSGRAFAIGRGGREDLALQRRERGERVGLADHFG